MTDTTTPADAAASTADATPDVESVLVSTSGAPRLHLPASDADGPRCSVVGDLREKPLAVYPPAHRTWCRYCLEAWRAGERDDADAASVEGNR
ncbi:hypothetical protein [Halarchaeum sp. P4]|uniref:hypothetical protein n=1 Tax=Halarchaeum sp. P4 TaxID=3421639 RepID=UPI003EBC1EF1